MAALSGGGGPSALLTVLSRMNEGAVLTRGATVSDNHLCALLSTLRAWGSFFFSQSHEFEFVCVDI